MAVSDFWEEYTIKEEYISSYSEWVKKEVILYGSAILSV